LPTARVVVLVEAFVYIPKRNTVREFMVRLGAVTAYFEAVAVASEGAVIPVVNCCRIA